jgi:hypothetical protein
MATSPQYAATVKSAQVQIATANTARDGTGTVGTLVTGATNGTRIDDITICAAGTTTAGVIRMFIHDGTVFRLLAEFLVTAVTPSTTVAVWSLPLYNMGIVLASGWSLRFSTNAAETFNVVVTRGGDL